MNTVVEDSLPKRKHSKKSITLDELKKIKLPTEFWGMAVPSNDRRSLLFHVSELQFSKNYPTLMLERLVLVKENNLEPRCEVNLKGLKVEEYPDIPSKKMLEGVLTAVNFDNVCSWIF